MKILGAAALIWFCAGTFMSLYARLLNSERPLLRTVVLAFVFMGVLLLLIYGMTIGMRLLFE